MGNALPPSNSTSAWYSFVRNWYRSFARVTYRTCTSIPPAAGLMLIAGVALIDVI